MPWNQKSDTFIIVLLWEKTTNNLEKAALISHSLRVNAKESDAVHENLNLTLSAGAFSKVILK